MKKTTLVFLTFILVAFMSKAQTDSTNDVFSKPCPRSYEVKQAWEIEGLVPMFITGGFHVAVCYWYEKFRFRVSIINGGDYDA